MFAYHTKLKFIFHIYLIHPILTTYAFANLASNQIPQIYDPESQQYYPISEDSLKYDPEILMPDPDPNEFPQEYLDSLLTHCDDPIPSFKEMFIKAWIAFKEFGFSFTRYPVSLAMVHRILMAIKPMQLFHAFAIAALLTIIRSLFKRIAFTPLVDGVGLSPSSARKLLESSWKAFWFLVMWLFSLKVLILSGRTDFQYPLRIFKGQVFKVGYFDVPTPMDYYLVYTLQLGFYLHSFWTVFFMDTWRKDSFILVIHHSLTVLLLEGSLILRLHRIGLLVVFLHDLNDVFLEIGKVNVYLRIRNGQVYPIHMKVANLCFVLFTSSWVLLRLYWFPLKVLHATSWGVYITLVGREARGFMFFNVMLWGLFMMHLYWFMYIVRMAIRLLTKPIEECEDIREYDSDELEDVKQQQNQHKPEPDDTSFKSNNHVIKTQGDVIELRKRSTHIMNGNLHAPGY